MSVWKIAWRSIQQRGFASFLTMLSMALGVMMVVTILSVHGIVRKSFDNNSQLGYNMIVGATKGGKLQITLNSVFYLSEPVENIPYDYYLEFLPPEERDRQFEGSMQTQLHDTTWEAAALAGSLTGMDGLSEVMMQAASEAAEDHAIRQGDYTPCIAPLITQEITPLQHGRKTKYGELTAFAIPLCLGDYIGPYRVVGTTPDFFEKLRYGAESENEFEFAVGRNFEEFSDEHGYFEAVLGAAVAKEMELKVGDTFAPAHGATEEDGGDVHATKFTIVGVLAPSGTPNDRAAFINIEGFFLMAEHAKPVEDDDVAAESTGRRRQPLPIEQREVTAVLVRTISPAITMGMQNAIDEQDDAQVVLPVLEIYRLFEVFVNPIQRLLIILTGMICVVSGVSILVSIYNSMSERRHEIAVMRALGASRSTVMTIILLESVILATGGGLIGWISGHTLNALASGRIEELTGVTLRFWDMAPSQKLLELSLGERTIPIELSPELLIIPGLIILAIIVGLFPAATAYNTDVAESLGD